MDPLSIIAGVIAVANLAASTCSAISDLRSLCKGLPGRLHAVANEVADLELILTELSMLLQERRTHLASQVSLDGMPHLLGQAKSALDEISTIIERLAAASVGSRLPLLGAAIWKKEQGHLQALQADIRNIKSSLNIHLGASNSKDLMKIRLHIEEVSGMLTRSSSQQQLVLTGIDQRVAHVESLLRDQSEQLQARQFTQVGEAYAVGVVAKTSSPDDTQSSVMEVRPSVVRRHQSSSCRAGCRCSCHMQKDLSTPEMLNGVFGRLSLRYNSGLPLFGGAGCDTMGCRNTQDRRFGVEYWLPTSLWSTILRVQVCSGLAWGSGPSLQLDMLRRIADDSQAVGFAQKGNITGLQRLFTRGLASPRDVSSSRGYTLLRWALYSKQYEAVVFLVQAGADPDYRPIAASDNSPRIKACHFMLEGGLSKSALEAMRTITNGDEHMDDFIDNSNFTQIHKIVLGLSRHCLEEEIRSSPRDLDAQDAMGRTPLAWAAARGDTQMVATLISHGADPNIFDVQLSGPLNNAASQGHTACVELLLQAGADPDPPLPKGIKKGTALSVATRNGTDATLLKRLLDFGAKVDTLTVEDKTPLFHAARVDNASFAMLLLEYGANINAMSTTNETPLTTAITHNSHNVLRLFLDRWAEYTVCPRMRGPNLVGIAALYADCETLSILSRVEHVRMMHDGSYASLGTFEKVLSQRVDVTEKLKVAFEELLDVINMPPPPPRRCTRDEFDVAEKGHSNFGHYASSAGKQVITVITSYESDEESSGSFQDALEQIEIQV